ncbi:MAG: hypothetical protein K2L53_03615, partial [Clostridia bacterium]|nr:hypothetical protein [Clostridia bacterium]
MYNDKSDIDDKPYDFIKKLEEYDEILKASSYDEIFISKEDILLSRKLVDYYGYGTLQEFAHIDEAHKRTIEWILSDTEALKYFVTSGEPGKTDLATTKTNALNVLHTMYSTYASDMDDATATQYTTLGNLYKRMIISISLAYASDIKFNFYGGKYENSDPVKRYAIYKKLHAEGNLKNEIFENLTVPQMRHVLGSTLDDEEIEWLNWYVREKMNGNLNCHAYMPYRGGNYQNYAYYNPANYDTWDAKYNLKAFNITYGNKNYPKLWMVYEQGAFCGGISQNGIYVCQVLGIPAQKMTQPVHGAYLHLTRDSNGQFAWSSAYDIYGVHNSGGTAEDPIMMRWGFRPWNSSHAEMSGTITYLHNVQHVLNDYENYLKAEEVRILADVYTNYPGAYNSETYVADGSDPENNKNAGKLKEIYEKVLEYSPYHLYGWYGLINAYKDDLNSTPKDFALIAKRISEMMYIHPFPMYDLFRSIESKVKDTPYYASFTNYLKSGLEKGRIAGTDSLPTDYVQSNVSRAVASRILGFPETNSEVATFSFDGANAGKIILCQKYYNNNISWEYNLGEGWKQTLEKEVKLTSEEIASITVENDIRIHIVGVDYSEENIYT